MVKKRGCYKKILASDSKSGWQVFQMQGLDDNGETVVETVTGLFPLSQVGAPIEVTGERGNDGSIKADKISLVSDDAQLLAVLERCLSRKTDARNARLSEKEIGLLAKVPKLFELSCEPNSEGKISEQTGIRIDNLFDFTEKIRLLQETVAVFDFLRGMNDENRLSYTKKLVSAYPDNILQVIEDPYRMLQVLKTMRFRPVDQMAMEVLHISPNDERRLNGLSRWGTQALENRGHSCLKFEEVAKAIRSMAEKSSPYVIEDQEIEKALQSVEYAQDPLFPGMLYSSSLREAEEVAAREFVRLLANPMTIPFHPEIIDQVEKEIASEMGFDYHFGSQQREAFQMVTETGICVLNGDPGTGKTTTLNAILKYLENVFRCEYERTPKIELMAPSGMAAKRMSAATGREAGTINKKMKCVPDGKNGYKCRDKSDMFDADIVVVDEVSMLGLSMFSKLMSVIPTNAGVILIGDPNQLQSVDPGDVLNDILKSGYTNQCHLTEVFRQGKESMIAYNSKQILNGRPDLKEGDDFKYLQVGQKDMLQTVVNSVKELVEAGEDPDNIMVLAPMKNGVCGVLALNDALRPIMNQGRRRMFLGKGNKWQDRYYLIGDRIIMLSNNYALGYFNGDIGHIVDFKYDESKITVDIDDNIIDIPQENWSDMALAYAITIHKSQGSEYKNCIVCLPADAAQMLNRNLFYTGVTRVKKYGVVVANPGMVKKAVQTITTGVRYSNLVARIDQEAKKLMGEAS